jgi:hypothetical protein
MFTATPSDELDQRVLVAKLRIDLVVELVVEVGEHGGVSLPPFYPAVYGRSAGEICSTFWRDSSGRCAAIGRETRKAGVLCGTGPLLSGSA